MTARQIIDKIEQTVAILALPLGLISQIWFDVDIAIYTEATAGLIISIGEYIKLFLPNTDATKNLIPVALKCNLCTVEGNKNNVNQGIKSYRLTKESKELGKKLLKANKGK